MAVDDALGLSGIVPEVEGITAGIGGGATPAGTTGSVVNGGPNARFRVFMRGRAAGAGFRHGHGGRSPTPRSPARPGTAHAVPSSGAAAAGGGCASVPASPVVHGGITPRSARSVHSMRHCVSREQRAKLMSPPKDLTALQLDYDVRIDATSRCRRAPGVAFEKQESRAQREKATDLAKTVSHRQTDVPTAWGISSGPAMDKGISREKVNALRLRMKLDLPWYNGLLVEKHVQTVDMGAQSARRTTVYNRAKGQDEFYNVQLKGTADKGKHVKGHVSFRNNGGRAVMHGRAVKNTNRKVDIALRPQYTQVANSAESGKHVSGPNFAAMRSKMVAELTKDNSVPLNLQYTHVEKRVRNAIGFEKQAARPNTFLKTKGGTGGPAPYDVSVDYTRPRQGAAYAFARASRR